MCVYIYIKYDKRSLDICFVCATFTHYFVARFNGLISDGANSVIITEKPVPSLYIHSTLSSAD